MPETILALATLVTAVGGFIVAWRAGAKVDRVDKKVDTLNESTLGQLAASGETRRIHSKEDRGLPITEKEQRHVDADKEREP